MSELLINLGERDKDILHYYIDKYGESSGAISRADIDYFLRFWNSSKAPFYHAFGNKFILEKKVAYNKPIKTIRRDIRYMLSNENCCVDFVNTWCGAVYDLFYFGTNQKLVDGIVDYGTLCDSIARLVVNIDGLVENRNPFDLEIPAFLTKSGKPFKIVKGAKLLRIIGKLCHELNFQNRDELIRLFEDFRLAHSQVLNQKTVEGTLCLSIHPMDYVTMSDNESGWSSCMSWMEESGDYRVGTLEMMNSPYVIVAYLKSDSSEMALGNDYYWDDKRWRQLIIVTHDLIVGNRQYPYDNNILEETTLSWVRDLMMNTESYGPYPTTLSKIVNHENNYFDNDVGFLFEIETDMMYNDVYDGRYGYFYYDENTPCCYYLNYSGPATCIHCGKIIENPSDNSIVVCSDCDGSTICDCCGNRVRDEDTCLTSDGYYVCSDCWECEVYHCPCCHGVYMDNSSIIQVYIEVDGANKSYALKSINKYYYFFICRNCISRYMFMYPSAHLGKNMWGDECLLVNLEDIEPLSCPIGGYASVMLDKVKRAATLEEQEKICKNYGF